MQFLQKFRGVTTAGALALFAVADTAYADNLAPPKPSPPPVQLDEAFSKLACGRRGNHQVGELFAYNDVFGSYKAPDPDNNFKQCLKLRPTSEGQVAARYEWDFKLKRGLSSYPHLTYGWDWYGDYSTGKLPQLVSQLKPIVVDYEEKTYSDSFYDVAFDIWLSKSMHPVRETITKEVMIWVQNGGTPQSRKLYASPTIAGYRFDLYVGPVAPDAGKWVYMAFIAKSPIPKAKLDISQFILYLKAQGLIEDDEYVNGVSFGTEVSTGTGYMDIPHFSVNAN